MEDDMSKELRKQINKYQQVCRDIREIAVTLAQWGYYMQAQAIDGHSPLTLAA
jgi:hypothetical protein